MSNKGFITFARFSLNREKILAWSFSLSWRVQNARKQTPSRTLIQAQLDDCATPSGGSRWRALRGVVLQK